MDNINIRLDDNAFISGSSMPLNIREPNVIINESSSTNQAATIEIGNVETLPPDDYCYVRNSGSEIHAILDFGIVRGKDGTDGTDGTDGFSPIATVTPTETGATISITDVNGTTTSSITNGTDGTDGQDGFSPIANVTSTEYGALISITDKEGTSTAQVVDGYSPIANVTPTSTGATISITDVNGTTTANIDNGVDGIDGMDGFSPIANVTPTSTGATISITDQQGTTTANVLNGVDGTDGVTPNISATASVDSNVGTPSVTVTKSGTDAQPNFAFAFSNLKSFVATTLFSGTGTTTIDLSDSINNYDCIEIFGYESGNRPVYLKLYAPEVNLKFSMFCTFAVSTTIYTRQTTFIITANNKIEATSDRCQLQVTSSGNTIYTSGTFITITKIIGYKL